MPGPIVYGQGAPQPYAVRGLAGGAMVYGTPQRAAAAGAVEGTAAQDGAGSQGAAAPQSAAAMQAPMMMVEQAPLILGAEGYSVAPYGGVNYQVSPMVAPYGGVNYLASPMATYSAYGGVEMMAAAPMIQPVTTPGVVLYRNQYYIDSDQLLPAFNDPSDLFHEQLDSAENRLAKGSSPTFLSNLKGKPEAPTDLWARFKGLPSFGAWYDTGAFEGEGGAFDARRIDLGSSPAAGQTSFTGNEALTDIPLQFLTDAQAKSVDIAGAEDQQVQVLAQFDNYEERDQIRVAHLFGRMWNKDRMTLGGGKSFSLFSVNGNLPSSIQQDSRLVAAGCLDDSLPLQFRMQWTPPRGGGWGAGIGVEEGISDDALYPDGATALTRWPSLVGNTVYAGANPANRFQLSSIVRTLGFDDGTGAEFFSTAWGCSTHARWGIITEPDLIEGFYIGAAGGRGIGNYIRGIDNSVAFDNGALHQLTGAGAYVGHQVQWISSRGEFGSHMAYGYAAMDAEAFMEDNVNTTLHQAWANLIYYPTKYVGIGAEYQYGSRETLRHGQGEDHRFLLFVSLTSSEDTPEKATYYTESDQPKVAQRGVMAPESPTATGAEYSRQPGGDASRQAF